MKRERLVMVPWAPRPLIVPEDGDHRPHGLDEFVDGLLETDADERAGYVDVALLAGGAGVVVGGVAGSNSTDLLFTGAVAGIVGGACLLRTAWRALQRRRRARRRRDAAPVLGLPLVATHPATEALVAGYERLLRLAALPGVAARGQEAAVAGHLAVVEAATMLDGEPPEGRAQEEYVWQRTRAVETLVLALERQHLDAASRNPGR